MKSSNNIFTRHNVKFVPKEPISHLLVQNGNMLIVMQNSKLQHIRIQTAVQTDLQIQLLAQDKIAHIFLDYRGMHSIISTEMGENYYLNTKSLAPKYLKKLKGNVITAVGWNNQYGNDDTTGFIVLGTKKSNLIETAIVSDGQQTYLKTLTRSLCSGNELPVSQVHVGPCSLDNDNSWMVIICIPGRVYCLTGTLNLGSFNSQSSTAALVSNVWSVGMIESQYPAVLSSFFSSRNPPRYHFTQQQNDDLNSFCIYPVLGDDYELPEKYAWLSADGVSAGSIKTNKNDGYEMICQDWNIQNKLVEGIYKCPLDIALSEYHVVILYSDRFQAVSLLNQKVTFEDVFQSGLKVIGLTRDISSQFIWVYTENSIFNYRPNNEARDVWKILLERNDFVGAQKIAKQLPDPKPYQIVIKCVATNFLAQKNFVGAAELLVKSDEPFEQTVMKFLKHNSRESRNGLKSYLDLKLNLTEKLTRIQRDILIIWLLEIQLSELAELTRSVTSKEPVHESNENSCSLLTQKGNQMKKLREELYCFLNRQVVTESISENRLAIYRLIISHADFETQLYVANKLKDHDCLVKIHLLQNDYSKALEIVAAHPEPALFYKYGDDLFEHVPQKFVAALINAGRSVRPSQLISMFFNCHTNVEKVTSAFVYLNHAVNKDLADEAVHDFLIKLYAEARPNSLLEHLKKFGKNKRRVSYNVRRALSICLDKKLTECCVFLYCLEEMYETAVKLALTIRVDLAKECAVKLDQMCLDDSPNFLADDIVFMEASQREKLSLAEEVKKRVWLEIAKHMIQNNYDISQCMDLLKESNNAIKIQDILAFFPKFTKIEHLKQPLCDCLKEHALKIQELQKEMVYVSDSAAQIRSYIEKTKSNATVIKAEDKCAFCAHQLLSRPFFIFNCRHFSHYDCTIDYVRQCLSPKETALLNVLLDQERTTSAETLVKSDKEKMMSQMKLRVVKRKIQDLVASECPLCSHEKLNNLLAKPIISEESYEKLVEDWRF